MTNHKAKAEETPALTAEILRANRQIELCRRLITQARDQLVAVEIALSRAREGIGV